MKEVEYKMSAGAFPTSGMKEGYCPGYDMIWASCPSCKGLFMVDRLFWTDRFNELKLCCPYCNKQFDKKESPKTVGL